MAATTVAQILERRLKTRPKTNARIYIHRGWFPREKEDTFRLRVGALAQPVSRLELRESVARGDCEGFHVSGFARGHAPTDFARWLALETPPASSQGLGSYAATYAEGFEPYVLARVASVPRYDERFRGYGLNKVQHAFAMAQRGVAFEVLADECWVAADAHAKSSEWKKNYDKDSPEYDPEQALKVQALYNVFKKEERALTASAAHTLAKKTQRAGRLEAEEDPLGDADSVGFFEKLPTIKTPRSTGLSTAANLLLFALLAAAALSTFCASDNDDDGSRTLLRGSLRGLVAASQ